MKKELLIFGSLLCLMSGIGAVRAQTCATPPSCASLGYTMTSSDCSGQPTLVCPFDASAVFCAGTASSGGAGGSTGGGAGSGLIESCNGDCFVGFLYNNDSNYFKVIEKYKFVDGGYGNDKCTSTCRQNGMSPLIHSFQNITTLCILSNKTSGIYYYVDASYVDTGSSSKVLDCSDSTTTYISNIGASKITGCLCAKIVG